MARSHYNWQRFWILRGNSVYLSANGYLSGERRYLNPHIINMTPLGAPQATYKSKWTTLTFEKIIDVQINKFTITLYDVAPKGFNSEST